MKKYKIFYHPETLEIKGSSDGVISMDFPYVETKTYYHSLSNLRIGKDKKGKPTLIVAKGSLTEEDVRHLK